MYTVRLSIVIVTILKTVSYAVLIGPCKETYNFPTTTKFFHTVYSSGS